MAGVDHHTHPVRPYARASGLSRPAQCIYRSHPAFGVCSFREDKRRGTILLVDRAATFGTFHQTSPPAPLPPAPATAAAAAPGSAPPAGSMGDDGGGDTEEEQI